MKDMGRCGNVAFCALVLFYCSFITGDHLCVSSVVHVTSSPSVHSSVKRRDGVSDVNMTSSPQPESPNSDKTQSSTNHTNINITEPTPHTHASAVTSILSSGALAPSPTPAENISFSGNFTDIRNESDVSPVKYQTRVNTPTTLLPSTTNDPKTKIHNTTFHSTSNTAGISRPPSHESTTTRTRITSLTTRSPPATTSTVTTVMPVNSSPVQAKAHVDTPTALNVGDDDNSPKVSSNLLLTGLVSAFVVVAAIVSVLIFLKFRNKNDGPEFRRLQDLPMDDMLEDAPLSMYSY